MAIELNADDGYLRFDLREGETVTTVKVDTYAANCRLADLNVQYPDDGQAHDFSTAWLAVLMGEFGFPKVSHGVALKVAALVTEEAQKLTGKPVADSASTASSGSTASESAT